MNLKKKDLECLMKQKDVLRKRLKQCGIGNSEAKDYIKERILDMLLHQYKNQVGFLDTIIPFGHIDLLSLEEQFAILLYIYKKRYGFFAAEHLILENEMITSSKESGFIIEAKKVNQIFQRKQKKLSQEDQLQLVIQKVYQQYCGLGVVDELRDMKLDGISGGVSGNGEQEQSVWIYFKGKTVYLPFLEFGTKRELARVCRNICRYQQPGQLSETRGYIVNEMEDHARVVVARPPFSENWLFFVRKFDNLEVKKPEDLITDENASIPIKLIAWILKGCQVTGVTGAQGSGKTTLLMSIVSLIDPQYTLRILELAFELHLRDLYPYRNIVTFKETDCIGGQEALDLQKKTDGTVSIVGEVATAKVASWMIESGQTASLFSLFTHHGKTTKSLVLALRNSLLSQGHFQNEEVAQQQVVEVVRFDIHMEKNSEGHRYIEHITEIIPLDYKGADGNYFTTNPIVVFEENSYTWKNPISMQTQNEIAKRMPPTERKEFYENIHIYNAQI